MSGEEEAVRAALTEHCWHADDDSCCNCGWSPANWGEVVLTDHEPLWDAAFVEFVEHQAHAVLAALPGGSGGLARLRELSETATPGPWYHTSDPLGEHVENGDGIGRIVFGHDDRPEHADAANAAFMADAANYVRALVAEARLHEFTPSGGPAPKHAPWCWCRALATGDSPSAPPRPTTEPHP